MRKSKFRGKRVDTGEWVYGCLISDDGKSFIVSWVGYCGDEKYLEFADRYLEVFAYEVIPETVGQYTGVRCTNGKEIYGDDIIRIRYCGCLSNDSWDVCAVKYHGDEDYPAFDLVPPIGGESNGLSYAKALCEIEGCGNIHDNPELLEVGTGD
jgi:uncharacterized phage protein (TIGR01671 family)